MTAQHRAAIRRLAVAGCALAAAFAGLVAWVMVHPAHTPALDLTLHAAAVRHRTPSGVTVARAITNSAEGFAFAVAALGGVLALRPRQWWLAAAVGAAALGLGQLVRLGLSVAIARPRPPAADWATAAGGYALPSGHTTTATLAAGLLCIGLARSLREPWRIVGMGIAACWAIAVGSTRVYLGVHWPTDVLGGWMLGALLSVLAAALLLVGLDRGGSAGRVDQRDQLQRSDDGHRRDPGQGDVGP